MGRPRTGASRPSEASPSRILKGGLSRPRAEAVLYKRAGFCVEEAHSAPGRSGSVQKGRLGEAPALSVNRPTSWAGTAGPPGARAPKSSDPPLAETVEKESQGNFRRGRIDGPLGKLFAERDGERRRRFPAPWKAEAQKAPTPPSGNGVKGKRRMCRTTASIRLLVNFSEGRRP